MAPPSSTSSLIAKSTLSPLQKKQKMTLTQTYYVAHVARGKLSNEASRADHNLRLLVGHANLLDGLMLDLADAEREQESWFHASVGRAAQDRHIRFADAQPMPTEDYDEDDSDVDSDDEPDKMDLAPATPLRRVPSPPLVASSPTDEDEDDEEDDEDDEDDFDDDEDYGHELTRTASHSATAISSSSSSSTTHSSSQSLPDLLHESDSDSDDEPMPSPPTRTLDSYSSRQPRLALPPAKSSSATLPLASTDDDERPEGFYDDSFYLAERQTEVLVC